MAIRTNVAVHLDSYLVPVRPKTNRTILAETGLLRDVAGRDCAIIRL